MKKYLLAIIIVLLLGVGVVVGLLLVQKQQLFNQKASSQSGTATISISPASKNFDRGTVNTVSVYFNTKGISVKGISLRLNYANLGVQASGITINPDLLSQNWACPVKTISSNGSIDNIDISCAFIEAGNGYSNNADTLLATFTVTASQVPANNPVVFSFDPDTSLTVVSQASDGTDIALTPSSTGSYTITDTIAQSPTATPIIIVGSPTATPTNNPTTTATPTSSPTNAPTNNPTATATSSTIASSTTTPKATTSPTLPVSGFDVPTIIGGAAGVLLLIFGAAALIL